MLWSVEFGEKQVSFLVFMFLGFDLVLCLCFKWGGFLDF